MSIFDRKAVHSYGIFRWAELIDGSIALSQMEWRECFNCCTCTDCSLLRGRCMYFCVSSRVFCLRFLEKRRPQDSVSVAPGQPASDAELPAVTGSGARSHLPGREGAQLDRGLCYGPRAPHQHPSHTPCTGNTLNQLFQSTFLYFVEKNVCCRQCWARYLKK